MAHIPLPSRRPSSLLSSSPPHAETHLREMPNHVPKPLLDITQQERRAHRLKLAHSAGEGGRGHDADDEGYGGVLEAGGQARDKNNAGGAITNCRGRKAEKP